ncbi:hypothetical protein Pmani_008110 [Petrolisthes manimaculis]|uniref:Uncharacterized protein n=1 Tax=Petrolisthes manimaculis TaxID=1843537 RepID=A0AAE1Q776_9EUCA|nr:hypothetical protein Pmani_008110 [Petrolisthes manimaculis]
MSVTTEGMFELMAATSAGVLLPFNTPALSLVSSVSQTSPTIHQSRQPITGQYITTCLRKTTEELPIVPRASEQQQPMTTTSSVMGAASCGASSEEKTEIVQTRSGACYYT